MINNNELSISNKSYTNKDFASIYPELVDLVTKLTSRWDPTTSNESDPGVVLLKLMAFIADKNNYNIDKNVLERFPLSATQETSMRQLCEMLGYSMGYYKASETTVSMTYTGAQATFTLPALGTVISNDDGTICYVCKESVSFSNSNETITDIPVIQGTIKDLTVLSGSVITLENLDDDRRIYFPESMVAENGVFISGGNGGKFIDDSNYWSCVSNLNTKIPGFYVFKFGYDSSEGLPYIEFPSDIASLIGGGVTIKYIVTDGASGNVSARTLTKLMSPTSVQSYDGASVDFSGENNGGILTIKNASASTSGSDPETIDEAYNGYKKTVGTFDTLVTCRDYANAIYNMTNANGSNYVSNVNVTDRRTDINSSSKVVSYDDNGPFETTVVDAERGATAYDLILYPLTPYGVAGVESHNLSFYPMQSVSDIESGLDDYGYSTISHDYIRTKKADDVYLIKNKMKLNASLTTTSKVTNSERLDIVGKVRNALCQEYNARKLDYGYEIPFDSILKTIESSDGRIKSVSLAEPELTTYVVNRDGEEIALISSGGKDYFVSLAAKNALAGRVKLLKQDDRFQYAFGQEKASVYENIMSIKTEAKVTLNANETHTVASNEVIQLTAPSIITSKTYGYTINYRFVSSGGSTIPANVDRSLKAGETLSFAYTDSNDVERLIEYTATKITSYKNVGGTFIQDGSATEVQANIFRSSFAISDTDASSDTGIMKDGKKFLGIGTSDTIELRKANETQLKGTVPCYWVTASTDDNGNYKLPFEDSSITEYMLQDGEYFFYTDSTHTDLVSLGSGTVIFRNNAITQNGKWICKKASLSDVLQLGVAALEDCWVSVSPSAEGNAKSIMLRETQILTLNKGCSLTSSSEMELDNNPAPIETGVVISYDANDGNGTTVLTGIDCKGYSWKIRSRLDVSAGPSMKQTLSEGQSVEVLLHGSSAPQTIGSGKSFLLTKDVTLVGSDSIDMGEYVVTSEYPYTKKVYDVCMYAFEQGQGALSNPDGYSKLSVSGGKIAEEDVKTLSVPNVGKNCLAMMHWAPENGDETKTISISGVGVGLSEFGGSGITVLKKGLNNVKISFDESISDHTITLTPSEACSGNLIISKLIELNGGVGDDMGVDAFESYTGESGVADAIIKKALSIGGGMFDASQDPNPSKEIEFSDSDGLASPYALFDVNNIANGFVLCEIDFANSSIDVARSSRS